MVHQVDMERFAFLFLCGNRDRRILQGKEKMTFSDLDRLNYITDFLGLKLYGLEIWNKYAGQFREQFQQLQRLYDETSSIVPYDPSETDEDQQEQWVKDFCRQVPDRKSRRKLEEIVKQLYMERGWEGLQSDIRSRKKKSIKIIMFLELSGFTGEFFVV